MPRSLQVSFDYIKTVKSALKRKGFARQQDLAERVEMSRDTVNRFLNGKPVDALNFMELCSVLDLDQEKIATPADQDADDPINNSHVFENIHVIDWDVAPNVSRFYGREKEIYQLKEWILKDDCRVLLIYGMEGIGKTFLAKKIACEIQLEFDAVIWRTLREAKPCQDLLGDLGNHLYFKNREMNRNSLNKSEILVDIQRTIQSLQEKRCLIVLNNFEAIIQSAEGAGKLRPTHQAYGDLLQALSEQQHASCIVITSSDIPKDLIPFSGQDQPVRIYELKGLDVEACRQIIHNKGISGSKELEDTLIDMYSYHPKALQLISSAIQELYLGDIKDFLSSIKITNTPVFNGLRSFLDQQFGRLSPLEFAIINWLAIHQTPVTESSLHQDMNQIPRQKLRESLQSLRRRSFIERTNDGFTLQYFICSYVVNLLITNFFDAIEQQRFDFLNRYSLIQASTFEHIRQAQTSLILEPLCQRLIDFYGKSNVEKKLVKLLDLLRRDNLGQVGYAAGNIFNILVSIRKLNHSDSKIVLEDYNFSKLALWQADLRSAGFNNVNFSESDLSKAVFREAHGGVLALAISKDEKWIVIGDASHRAYIWQVQDNTLKPHLTLNGHTHWVRAVAISPDNKYIATGGEDRKIIFWDLESGESINLLKGYQGQIRALAFDPQGKYLASGSDDNTIVIWSIDTKHRYLTWETPDQKIRSVAFSADGSLLIAASFDGTIYIYDLKTDQKNSFFVHKNIRALAIHPTEESVISIGCDDGIVRILNINSQKVIREFKGHQDWIRRITFSADGRFLASGSEDSIIIIWNLEDSSHQKLLGHTSRVWGLVFRSNNNQLISVSDDQAVKIWNSKTGSCIRTFQGYACKIRSVTYCPEDKVIVTGSDDHILRTWDAKTGKRTEFPGHTGRVWSVCCIPNADILVSASDDRTIRIWGLYTGQLQKVLREHSSWVRCVAVHPDGSLIASVGDDKIVRIYNRITDEHKSLMPEHKDWVLSVAFSNNGKFLVTGSDDKMARIWNLESEKSRYSFEHNGAVRAVAFCPDDKYLATGCNDNRIRIWNLESQTCIELIGHKDWVRTIVFHPTQHHILASGGYDQAIILWDITTGQPIRTLKGHQEAVFSLDFNKAGSTLASGSEDETIKQWDIKTGECISTFRVPRPYEKMNITNAIGLTKAQRHTLKTLGAIEDSDLNS